MLRSPALVAVLLSSLALPAAAQTRGDDQPPLVVTSGEAEVTRAPDRAFVMVRAESRAKDPKEAQRLNAQAMDAVTIFLGLVMLLLP